MKKTLNYGRITWSYDDFDPQVPCRPNPLITFTPFKINGKLKHPIFTDKVGLSLLLSRGPKTLSFRDAYTTWFCDHYFVDKDLGEGRSFARWVYKNQISIQWKHGDFSLHKYFQQSNSPKHDPGDEMSRGQSFAVKPVEVSNRKVKLYLEDEAVLNLINLPYGEDRDFIELVRNYVRLRFQWEEWRAPAPPFLDWVKSQGQRPVFSSGQLGLCLSNG